MPSRQDRAFFDAFSSHAGKSSAAASLLLEMMNRLPSESPSRAYRGADDGDAEAKSHAADLARLATGIKELESEGDTITRETMKRLRENWITPLDRSDIHQLMSRLDDVLDEIEAVADRLVIFEIQVMVAEALELAAILVRSCEALAKAINLLRSMRNAKEILELCAEVTRLENAADRTHRKAMSDLFRAGHAPLAVMKWKDLFGGLEAAADRCEDVANIIEGVVLEYA